MFLTPVALKLLNASHACHVKLDFVLNSFKTKVGNT